MANNPFDRTVINVRERPLSSDINQAQSTQDLTLRSMLDQLFLPRASLADPRAGTPVNGFIGDAFRVVERSPADLSINVTAGVGFKHDASDTPTAIGGVPNVDDLGRYKPIILLAGANIAIPAPDPTNPRIDIVEVNINRRLADPASRDVLNPTTGVFDPTSVQKTLAWNIGTSIGTVATPANSTAALSLKTGVASATPSVPPTSPGYVKIAEILVGGGVTQIDQNVIQDLRNLLALAGMQRVAARATRAAGAVALNSLKAPPGVQVAHNDTGGTNRLYILGGNVGGATPIAVAARDTAATTTAIPSIVVVDAALQTALATAGDTDPPLEAAVGQSVILIEMTVADDTYNVQVEW